MAGSLFSTSTTAASGGGNGSGSTPGRAHGVALEDAGIRQQRVLGGLLARRLPSRRERCGRGYDRLRTGRPWLRAARCREGREGGKDGGGRVSLEREESA
jgi:hypothetical protein